VSKRILAAIVVTGAVSFAMATGHADSTECNDHMVLPVSQPSDGIFIANEGDVQNGKGSLYVCNTGVTIPAPARAMTFLPRWTSVRIAMHVSRPPGCEPAARST